MSVNGYRHPDSWTRVAVRGNKDPSLSAIASRSRDDERPLSFRGTRPRPRRRVLGATDEWMTILQDENAPCTPVRDVETLVDHPHIETRGMVAEMEHPELESSSRRLTRSTSPRSRPTRTANHLVSANTLRRYLRNSGSTSPSATDCRRTGSSNVHRRLRVEK